MCLGIPGKIIEISQDEPLFTTAKVAFGKVIKEVSLVCLPDAKIGDYAIVHAGIALSIVDEVEAEKIFQLIASFDDGC